MNVIKLKERYPESRKEDITDAYMRGFEVGLAMRADIEQGDRIDSDQPDIDDVADFAANVLGVELYPWQQAFIAAAIDRNRIAGLEKRIELMERKLNHKGGEA